MNEETTFFPLAIVATTASIIVNCDGTRYNSTQENCLFELETCAFELSEDAMGYGRLAARGGWW